MKRISGQTPREDRVTMNRSSAVADRHRWYLVAPPGADTLPDPLRARHNFLADGFDVSVLPTAEPIYDERGRIVAPPQTVIVDRPFGPWTQNAQVSA